jgi:hypothetical protein
MQKLAGGVNIGTVFRSPFGKRLGLGDIVQFVLSAGITLGGIIAILVILLGGFKIIMGAGKGDANSTAKGKAALTYGVAGFFIVLAAYWIIRMIEIIIGDINIVSLPKIG